MCAGLVEKVSVAVLSAAYAVEHLSEMILLMRSNPIFCSSLVSIVLFSLPNLSLLYSVTVPHGLIDVILLPAMCSGEASVH